MLNNGEKKLRLGEILIQNGQITPAQLEEALMIQKDWGSRLGDVIMAKGWVTSKNFYQTLAEHFRMPFVDFYKEPADPTLVKPALYGRYLEYLVIPYKHREGRLIVAITDIGESSLEFAERQFGSDVDYVMTSKFDIIWHLQACGNDFFSETAVNSLSFSRPKQSAKQVFTIQQLIQIGLLLAAFIGVFVGWPTEMLIGLNVLAGLFFIVNFLFKATLAWVGSHKKVDMRISGKMLRDLDDSSLPLYTVLVPMYKEAKTLPIIAASLRRLDYPKSKLDVKLVLEEDDHETIQAAKDLGLESFFEIIRVPASMPKTKPKACNYALNVRPRAIWHRFARILAQRMCRFSVKNSN